MAEKKEQWITVKGNHILIPEGKSKDEAVKEFLDSKKQDTKKDYNREADIALTMMAHDYEKRGNKATVDEAKRIQKKLKEGKELTDEEKSSVKIALDTYKPKESKEQDNKTQKYESIEDIRSKDFGDFLRKKGFKNFSWESSEGLNKIKEAAIKEFNLKKKPSNKELFDLCETGYEMSEYHDKKTNNSLYTIQSKALEMGNKF